MWFKRFWEKMQSERKQKPLSDKEVVKLVGELKKQFLNQCSQETISNFKDECDFISKQFSANVGRRCWKLSQKWCKWDDDSPILQPNNSRLFYKKGDTEIMIIEQDPQVRTLRFGIRSSGQVSLGDKSTYNLALPYVIFIFRFSNGRFSSVHCMFNDRPLKNLTEKPFVPYLTNIEESGLKCCLGSEISLPEDLSYKQIVEYTLNHFWSATHSPEWDDHWRSNQKHFESNDSRLASLEAWEEATKQNPLFVIDDVQWIGYKDSIGNIVVNLTKSDDKVMKFDNVIFDDLVSEFLNEVKGAMKKAIKDSPTQLDNSCEEVEKKLTKAMKKLNLV